MVVATEDFNAWLAQAEIPQGYLTPEVQTLLQAAFAFRKDRGADYFSTRLLSHFLLHCESGLKVAHIARLLGLSRPTASGQQGLSSKQAIQQAHHRLDGRPYGKLLPRFAGPIAAFLLAHPHARRADLIAFVQTTFAVRVSRVALYKFLKKYGLNHLAAGPQTPATADLPATVQTLTPPPSPETLPVVAQTSPSEALPIVPQDSPSDPVPVARQGPVAEVIRFTAVSAVAQPAGAILVPGLGLELRPPPAPPFSTLGRNTPEPSC